MQANYKRIEEWDKGGSMIAIDFDGVLHQYHGWNGGVLNEPMPGAKKFIEEVLKQGAEIAVFSTRNAVSIAEWLHEHGFPPLFVTDKKLGMFHVFLDDRAITFTPEMFENPKELLKKLVNFEPHWKSEKTGN